MTKTHLVGAVLGMSTILFEIAEPVKKQSLKRLNASFLHEICIRNQHKYAKLDKSGRKKLENSFKTNFFNEM